MKSKDEVIDALWASANHGTRREDIAAAFEAGAAWTARPAPARLDGVDVDELQRYKAAFIAGLRNVGKPKLT